MGLSWGGGGRLRSQGLTTFASAGRLSLLTKECRGWPHRARQVAAPSVEGDGQGVGELAAAVTIDNAAALWPEVRRLPLVTTASTFTAAASATALNTDTAGDADAGVCCRRRRGGGVCRHYGRRRRGRNSCHRVSLASITGRGHAPAVGRQDAAARVVPEKKEIKASPQAAPSSAPNPLGVRERLVHPKPPPRVHHHTPVNEVGEGGGSSNHRSPLPPSSPRLRRRGRGNVRHHHHPPRLRRRR